MIAAIWVVSCKSPARRLTGWQLLVQIRRGALALPTNGGTHKGCPYDSRTSFGGKTKSYRNVKLSL
jgi:hypothetical protein